MSPDPATTAPERLLIVSPVYNEAGHLERTAQAIAAQERRRSLGHRGRRVERRHVGDRAPLGARAGLRDRAQRPATRGRHRPRPSGPGQGGPGLQLRLVRPAQEFTTSASSTATSNSRRCSRRCSSASAPTRGSGSPAVRLEPSRTAGSSSRSPTATSTGRSSSTAECLEAIGGITERLAWDTVDETYARMRGFDTRSLPELVARHHRHWGSADGRLRGRARHGECSWILIKPAVGAAALAQARPRPALWALRRRLHLRLPARRRAPHAAGR